MRVMLPALLLLAACSRDAGNPAPPRVDTPMPVPALTSTIAVPISADLDALEAALNAKLPKSLWTMDEVRQDCVAAQRLTIKVLGIKKARITPDIACRITGEATRGEISLGGDGEILKISLPITAQINARDAGKKLAGETATARAVVTASVRVTVTPEWDADTKVALDYKWLDKPSLKVLGIKIGLEGPANKALATLLPKLETEIPRQLAALHTRDAMEELWASGFTTIELNHENPEIWMSVSPELLHVSPLQVSGRTITLPLTLQASAETIIGHRPENPQPTLLPPAAPPVVGSGVSLSLPVITDYTALEPVLKKALDKLATKGFSTHELGRVDLKFGNVTLYAINRGRMAVGVQVDAKSETRLVDARGTLWLAARPRNLPGSQRITFEGLEVASQTNNTGFDLLVGIADTAIFRDTISSALAQDFSKDLNKLLTKLEPKLAKLPIGKSFILNARITSLDNGEVAPLGQGIFLPVTARAEARLIFRPAPASDPAPARTASGPP